MIISDYGKKWLTKANRDFMTAEKLLEFSEDNSLTEAICFHSGQSVDKFLKAYLLLNEIPNSQTENIQTEGVQTEDIQTESLDELINKCISCDADFAKIKTGNLPNYVYKTWSPEEVYIPTLKESHEAFLIAKSVRSFVLEKLRLGLNDLPLF